MPNDLLPFGKYRGRHLTEVLATDPNYGDWLKSQDWFVKKYPLFQQIIVELGNSAEETPEHNSLQARFLDEQFCEAVARAIWPADIDHRLKQQAWKNRRSILIATVEKPEWDNGKACTISETKRSLLRLARLRTEISQAEATLRLDVIKRLPKYGREEDPAKCRTVWEKERLHLSNQLKKMQTTLAEHRRSLTVARTKVAEVLPLQAEIKFHRHHFEIEKHSDVFMDVSLCAALDPAKSEIRETFCIEVKPSMGDDYPAALREINAQRERLRASNAASVRYWVLLVGHYTGQAVDQENVKALFKQSDISMVVLGVELKNTKLLI
ncbi:MAG TPA: hypothetical protein VMF58_02450 [Rhizomicrobium sp.]|nr:hypothetical protein [Rhizomicrobium sp.]